MTFTRAIQSGFELANIFELAKLTTYGQSDPVPSSTKANAGTYSISYAANQYQLGLTQSITQVRSNFYINHNGLVANANSKPILFYIPATVGPILVYWNQADNSLKLDVNSVNQDSVVATTQTFSTVDTWHKIGITYLANATTGFVNVYVNGTKVLTFTGNTGTSATGIYFGGNVEATAHGWASTAYIDDFYVDTSDGDSDAVPPYRKFAFQAVNGAGSLTNWTPNTGTNYQAVDDAGNNDGDTTYVYANASGQQDSYNTANYTLTGSDTIVAVIPIAVAKKTNAGVASTLKLGNYNGTAALSAEKSLTTSYAPYWERFTTDPSTSAWSETTVNSNEVMIESAGAYT